MMWTKVTTMLIAGAVLACVGSANADAKLELLGQPCRAKNVLASCVVKDRATGRDMFVLSNMNENSGAELIFIDFEKNTGKVYRAPAGAGAWGLKEVPGDRLVVSTFYDGVFMIFDLKKMEFAKVIQFPGESYIWNLAMGGDGRLYGGTYPGGKLGALDLDTYKLEDCGAPAPPNLYLRYVSPTPAGDVLCYFNTEKATTLLYDPATKKYRPAPQKVNGGVPGIVWNNYFVAGKQVFAGKELDEVTPIPFPTPPADKGTWSFDTSMTTASTIYMRQGDDVYSYTLGDKDLKLVTSADILRGGYRASGSHGELLGLRGQDYFVVKPGENTITLRQIPAESGPRNSLFLRVAPDGKLWGGPTFGQTLWWMDPTTKKYVNTGIICDAGGEAYDVAFANGKVYAVSYAGGDITEYDPSQPWDQVNGKNPKVIKRVGPGYIRPEGGASLGPDGKLYVGWLARYGKYGGAISITDPKTGDTEIIENPLGEQGMLTVISDGAFAYGGTTLGGNGLPNKTGESARFGVVDLATKKTVFQKEFDGCHNVHVLAYDPESKRVLLTADGKAMLFDTTVRGFVKLDAPDIDSRCVGVPGDGTVIYGSDKAIVKLDIRSGKHTIAGNVPDHISNVACGPNGQVYISCGVSIYAVKVSE